LNLKVSFAKEPYKRDLYSSKRHIILRSLLIVATPYSGSPVAVHITHKTRRSPYIKGGKNRDFIFRLGCTHIV